MSYCAITADVNKSRDIPERKLLQNNILDALTEANRLFKKCIVADFAITLGDEWQGVLVDISQSYKVVSFFQEKLYPISVSFGVGEGEIATEISSKSVEMDGEVFRRSREALNFAKKKTRQVFFITDHSTNDQLLNTTLHLLQILKDSWTNRQYQKIMLYKELKREKVVADKLNISQTDVNQALSAGQGRVYLEAQETLHNFLAQFHVNKK